MNGAGFSPDSFDEAPCRDCEAKEAQITYLKEQVATLTKQVADVNRGMRQQAKRHGHDLGVLWRMNIDIRDRLQAIDPDWWKKMSLEQPLERVDTENHDRIGRGVGLTTLRGEIWCPCGQAFKTRSALIAHLREYDATVDESDRVQYDVYEKLERNIARYGDNVAPGDER